MTSGLLGSHCDIEPILPCSTASSLANGEIFLIIYQVRLLKFEHCRQDRHHNAGYINDGHTWLYTSIKPRPATEGSRTPGLGVLLCHELPAGVLPFSGASLPFFLLARSTGCNIFLDSPIPIIGLWSPTCPMTNWNCL